MVGPEVSFTDSRLVFVSFTRIQSPSLRGHCCSGSDSAILCTADVAFFFRFGVLQIVFRLNSQLLSWIVMSNPSVEVEGFVTEHAPQRCDACPLYRVVSVSHMPLSNTLCDLIPTLFSNARSELLLSSCGSFRWEGYYLQQQLLQHVQHSFCLMCSVSICLYHLETTSMLHSSFQLSVFCAIRRSCYLCRSLHTHHICTRSNILNCRPP